MFVNDRSIKLDCHHTSCCYPPRLTEIFPTILTALCICNKKNRSQQTPPPSPSSPSSPSSSPLSSSYPSSHSYSISLDVFVLKHSCLKKRFLAGCQVYYCIPQLIPNLATSASHPCCLPSFTSSPLLPPSSPHSPSPLFGGLGTLTKGSARTRAAHAGVSVIHPFGPTPAASLPPPHPPTKSELTPIDLLMVVSCSSREHSLAGRPSEEQTHQFLACLFVCLHHKPVPVTKPVYFRAPTLTRF